MSGWLKGIFEWLWLRAEPIIREVTQNVGRLRWLLVGVLGAVFLPLSSILGWLVGLSQGLGRQLSQALAAVQSLGMADLSGFWSVLAQGSALANCLFPLDYAVQLGTALVVLWVVLMPIRIVLWLWKLVPWKFS